MRWCVFFVASILLFAIANNNFADTDTKHSKYNATELFYSNISIVKFEFNNGDSVLSDEQRGKHCLDNITECMDKDLEYQHSTEPLSDLLLASLPPFDLSRIDGVSTECKRQSRRYIEDLKQFKFWALKMYDSSAKLPSGILNGNLNQFGDFDMCLDSVSESAQIKGKYCLAYMEIQTPRSSYLSGLHQLIQSHHHFRNKLEDPGHRVPRFSTTNWALCVPSACSADDVEKGLRTTVDNIIDGTEIKIRYKVDSEMCQTKTHTNLPLTTYIAIGVFGGILIWELFATLYHYCSVGERIQWIMAFSLKKNIDSLVRIKDSEGDIEAVHGVRCLNAVLLMVAHKCMALFFQPYTDRTAFAEFIARPFSVVGRTASLYTDPFIMISGMLTTYSLVGKLNRTGRIQVWQEYISRLFRIVPAFAALIAFCTFILPWLNSGPQWNLVITHHSDICKQNWWRNMLFIHNYYGFEDMCLTHTHHVGIDTQLFFASPFLIYVLWKWPRKGTAALVTIATISTIMRYYVTYTMKLSNYVHFGTSIKQLFETADNMYILPAHRATVYIIGIFIGYWLRHSRNVQFTKTQLSIGNTLAFISFCWSFFGAAYMGSINYVYKPQDAAWYAAISPILWCFSFAWIIITSQLGYKSLLGRVFSAKLFRLWTKISYTVYLTQFPVYFYNVGTIRSSTSYSFFSMLLNLKEYMAVIVLSIILTVTIEMPFHNIRHILLGNNKHERLKNCYQKSKVP